MQRFTLTDISSNQWTERFDLTSHSLGLPSSHSWSVVKHTLRGGRREGVEVVSVDTGRFRFDLLPTRGMGIAQAFLGETRIGWRSPVHDGPVHPAYVNQEAWGGLGWLDGFDELLVRCGLETNGPPFTESGRTYTLHGRIANLPAQRLIVEIDESPLAIHVEGTMTEERLFGPRWELTSRFTASPGEPRIKVRDTIRNRSDRTAEFVLLYHWNLGLPLLDEGSRFHAPIRLVCPRTAAAAAMLDQLGQIGEPRPGSVELVYFFELIGRDPDGQTLVLLHNRAGDLGVAIRFSILELPRFVLWKNLIGTEDGYVVGLEPAVNYPNPTPYERAKQRSVRLEPGATHTATTEFEVLESADRIESIRQEIGQLQARALPEFHSAPVEPFVAS